jgi:hypothetical protein
MDLDYSKAWLAGAGALVGAVTGAWVWAQHAAAVAAKTAQAAGDEADALIHTAASTGTATLGAALQGAMVGGVLGLVAVFAWFYFTDPDRGFQFRSVSTGDDSLSDPDTGLTVRKSTLDENQ